MQAMEGFARGSNPGEFKNTAENVILDIVRATDGRILEGGGFDNTPDGIFAALNRETAYGGTILRDNSSSLDAVAGKYGYETIFDLVNDIGSFRSSIQEYRSTAGRWKHATWKAGWILLPPKDGTRLPFPPRISPGTGRYSFQGTPGWTSSHAMCLFWPGNSIFRWK